MLPKRCINEKSPLKIDGHGDQDSDHHGYKKYEDLPEPCGHPGICYSSVSYSVHDHQLFFDNNYASKMNMMNVQCRENEGKILHPYHGRRYFGKQAKNRF